MRLKVFFLGLFLLAGVATSDARKEGNKFLNLLYWNIQNGMWDGQTDDYKRFTDWVSSQKPDICVWCEAQTRGKRKRSAWLVGVGWQNAMDTVMSI